MCVGSGAVIFMNELEEKPCREEAGLIVPSICPELVWLLPAVTKETVCVPPLLPSVLIAGGGGSIDAPPPPLRADDNPEITCAALIVAEDDLRFFLRVLPPPPAPPISTCGDSSPLTESWDFWSF
jgi:hypothetical protein